MATQTTKFQNIVKLVGKILHVDPEQGIFTLLTHFNGKNGDIDIVHTVRGDDTIFEDLVAGDRKMVTGKLYTIFDDSGEQRQEVRTIVKATKISDAGDLNDVARCKIVGKLMRSVLPLNKAALFKMNCGQANVWIRALRGFMQNVQRKGVTNGSIMQVIGNLNYDELDTVTLTTIVASDPDKSFLIMKAAVVDEFTDIEAEDDGEIEMEAALATAGSVADQIPF